MKKHLLLILTLLLCFVGQAWGATYYVDADADAGGDGTTTATTGANCAFDTIVALEAGVAAGTHAIYFQRGDTWDDQLDVKASWTIDAYGSGAKPHINDTDGDYGVEVTHDADNVTIQNIQVTADGDDALHLTDAAGNTIDSLTLDSVDFTAGVGFGLYVPNSNVIVASFSATNCTFTGANRGVYIRDDATFDGTFTSCAFSGTANSGFEITSDSDGLTLTNCTSDSNGDDGFKALPGAGNTIESLTISGGSYSSNGSAQEGNGLTFDETNGTIQTTEVSDITAANNAEDGINVRSGADVNITNAVVYSNGTDALAGDGDGVSYHLGSTGTIDKCQIYNNLKGEVVNTGTGAITIKNSLIYYTAGNAPTLGVIRLPDDTAHTIYNCTFYAADGDKDLLYISADDGGGTLTVKNSIFLGGDDGLCDDSGGDCTIDNDYNCFYGQDNHALVNEAAGANSLTADPRLTDDFWPQNPALWSAGTDLTGTVDEDYYGISRDTTPTIGAVEVGLMRLNLRRGDD